MQRAFFESIGCFAFRTFPYRIVTLQRNWLVVHLETTGTKKFRRVLPFTFSPIKVGTCYWSHLFVIVCKVIPNSNFSFQLTVFVKQILHLLLRSQYLLLHIYDDVLKSNCLLLQLLPALQSSKPLSNLDSTFKGSHYGSDGTHIDHDLPRLALSLGGHPSAANLLFATSHAH